MEPIILLGPDGPAKAEALEKIRVAHCLILRGEVNEVYKHWYRQGTLLLANRLPTMGNGGFRAIEINTLLGNVVVIMLEKLVPGQLERFPPDTFTVIDVTSSGQRSYQEGPHIGGQVHVRNSATREELVRQVKDLKAELNLVMLRLSSAEAALAAYDAKWEVKGGKSSTAQVSVEFVTALEGSVDALVKDLEEKGLLSPHVRCQAARGDKTPIREELLSQVEAAKEDLIRLTTLWAKMRLLYGDHASFGMVEHAIARLATARAALDA